MSQEKDKSIENLRFFCLISIILAHSFVQLNTIDSNISVLIKNFLTVYSLIGVPGFFLISGYLFVGKKYSLNDFFTKKIKNIIMPWIFCGLLIYFITNFPSYNFKKGFLFVIGYNSYLYYLTNLIFFFILFFVVKDNLILLLLSIILNIISLYFFQKGYQYVLSESLNPFNFIGYFAVGGILKKFNILNKIKLTSLLWKFVIILFGLIFFVIGYVTKMTSYYSIYSFAFSILIVLGLYTFSSFIKFNFFGKIGNNSFSIYLLHMPVVSFFKKIITRLNSSMYILIPFFVIFLFFLFFELLDKIENKIPFLKKIKILIGMR